MQPNNFETPWMIRARRDDLLRERRGQQPDRTLWTPRPAGPGRVRQAIGRRVVALGMALVG